jgi:polyhydroxybutyrate depolymerase
MKLQCTLLWAACCGAVCWSTGFAGTNVNGSITFAGKAHDYILHVPTKYTKENTTSLVISLHGYTWQPSTYMNVDSLWKTADTAGFLVVYPHGTNNSWNSGPYCCGSNKNDDVGLMRALIDTIAAKYSVDRNRVYAVGCSNGAMMANRLGAEAADAFAAVAGVAGPLAISSDNAELKPSRPVSVMDFHALTDQGVPYNGGFGGGAPAETLAMARWASANGCDIGPSLSNYDNLTTVKTWKSSKSPVEVILYTTKDGQHWWPPVHVPANTILWAFFQRHTLNEGVTLVKPPAPQSRGPVQPIFRNVYYDLRGKRLMVNIGKVAGIVIKRSYTEDGELQSSFITGSAAVGSQPIRP